VRGREGGRKGGRKGGRAYLEAEAHDVGVGSLGALVREREFDGEGKTDDIEVGLEGGREGERGEIWQLGRRKGGGESDKRRKARMERREGGREGGTDEGYTLTKSRMSPMGRLLRPCSISSPFSRPNHEMPAGEGGREGGREGRKEGRREVRREGERRHDCDAVVLKVASRATHIAKCVSVPPFLPSLPPLLPSLPPPTLDVERLPVQEYSAVG